MKLIRLVREPGAWSSERSDPKAEVWALDTPISRAALGLMVTVGNNRCGAGTHRIEEKEIGSQERRPQVALEELLLR